MEKIKYTSEDVVSHHGVAAVIKDAEGRVLMQKHIKYGFWTIPVGKVKEGQEIEEALKQEILEECNLSIKKHKEVIVRDYTYEREGNRVVVSSHLFEVIAYTGQLQNNEPQKHEKQLFMPLSEIKSLAYLSDLTLLYLETLGIRRKAKL